MAKERQFDFKLIFVMLRSPEMNVARVRIRVRKGGHAVPEEKITARWWRSLAQLPWFLEHADQAAIYDNSGNFPLLIGRKENSKIQIDQHAPAALREALGFSSEEGRP
jgi:predicted ABC-type ATPase